MVSLCADRLAVYYYKMGSMERRLDHTSKGAERLLVFCFLVIFFSLAAIVFCWFKCEELERKIQTAIIGAEQLPGEEGFSEEVRRGDQRDGVHGGQK